MRAEGTRSASSEDRADRTPRRNAWVGAAAGAIGLGCCLYPVVLVLLGLTTAAAAVDLGNRLFAEWGWAFKISGVAFAGSSMWVQRRKARRCSPDARPRLGWNAVVIALFALATYVALYAATTWLGRQAG